MLDYVDLDYRPRKRELIAEYYMEPAHGCTVEKAAAQVAAESSIGTWTDLTTMKPEIAKKLMPHVFEIRRHEGMPGRVIKIAYSADLFEAGNMSQILSAIAGNIFGMKTVDKLRLEDAYFPQEIDEEFRGPQHGIAGIRKMSGVKKRPFLGTIVKPKVGLNEKEHAKVAYECWKNGLDFVKDDENLTSMKFNNFEKRVVKTLDAMDKASEETGEKKFYICNVSAETEKMIKRAQFLKDHGGNVAMVDYLTVGFAGTQTLRNAEMGMIIHAHRAMHGAITRSQKHGISMLMLAKAARLIGVDSLHVGTANVGKMEGEAEEVVDIERAITRKTVRKNDEAMVLAEEWGRIKPVMPVASGGLNPFSIPKVIERMGKDVIIQFGGGCHGHPGGSGAGAKTIRYWLDSHLEGTKLEDAMDQSKLLRQAFKKWGSKSLF